MSTMCAAGVDIGRDWLDIAIASSGAQTGRAFRSPNAPKAWKWWSNGGSEPRWCRWCWSPSATKGGLVRALAQAGFEVGVVDPKRIKALRTAEGKRAKTDRLDAQLIARFALLMTDAARAVPSAETYQIRALSTRRRQLVELAAMKKTRLKQALDAEIADSCRAMIAQLQAERLRVEASLKTRLDQAPQGGRRAELLRSIPGFGPG